MTQHPVLPTPEHDEGPSRRVTKGVESSCPARALRPTTAAPDEPEGLSLSARFVAGVGTPIVDQHPRRWLPRRAIRGWFFAELLRLPRIDRQRATQGVVPTPGTGRARRASAERPGPRTVLAPLPAGADS